MKAIKWSENLDSIFTNNYRMDPSLSWQYFGSSFGFMRQYPGKTHIYFQKRFLNLNFSSHAVETGAGGFVRLQDEGLVHRGGHQRQGRGHSGRLFWLNDRNAKGNRETRRQQHFRHARQ